MEVPSGQVVSFLKVRLPEVPQTKFEDAENLATGEFVTLTVIMVLSTQPARLKNFAVTR